MRAIACLIGLGVLASCTTAPEQVTRTPEGQRQYEQLIAGKVAGPPVQCLQTYETRDMVPIDDSTVAYRQGGSRVIIAHLQSPCAGLGRGAAIMVTRDIGGSGNCRGDIIEMVDSSSRMTTGSCTFGEFIPYSRPR